MGQRKRSPDSPVRRDACQEGGRRNQKIFLNQGCPCGVEMEKEGQQVRFTHVLDVNRRHCFAFSSHQLSLPGWVLSGTLQTFSALRCNPLQYFGMGYPPALQSCIVLTAQFIQKTLLRISSYWLHLWYREPCSIIYYTLLCSCRSAECMMSYSLYDFLFLLQLLWGSNVFSCFFSFLFIHKFGRKITLRAQMCGRVSVRGRGRTLHSPFAFRIISSNLFMLCYIPFTTAGIMPAIQLPAFENFMVSQPDGYCCSSLDALCSICHAEGVRSITRNASEWVLVLESFPALVFSSE